MHMFMFCHSLCFSGCAIVPPQLVSETVPKLVECLGDEKSGMVCSDDGTRIIFHHDVARGFFTSKYSVKYDCVDKKLKTMGVLHFQVSIKVRLRGQGTENNGIS
ncbi:unnamed protein product [Prunus armeniaca]|uniref:Uncharacterized protein n=1 Tax=Prunus armeniaca TaxID=36596 RepID=A0A6J5UHN3_PRUAR|nr:unnamed protein product [Prunus armeniaca]